MKGFDMGKIKDSLNDIQKKLLKIVLILVGMEVVVTLLIGLPLSAAMFHTERLKDGITARDFFVFSAVIALGGKTAFSGDFRNGAVVLSQIISGGSNPVEHQLLRRCPTKGGFK